MKGEDSHTGLETLIMGVGGSREYQKGAWAWGGPHTLTLWPFSPGSPGSPSKPRSPYTKRHPLSLESLTLTVLPSPRPGPITYLRSRVPWEAPSPICSRAALWGR